MWKGAYPYEYMNDWEKFSETLLSEEEDFYSHFNMKDILIQITRWQKGFPKTLK